MLDEQPHLMVGRHGKEITETRRVEMQVLVNFIRSGIGVTRDPRNLPDLLVRTAPLNKYSKSVSACQ